MATDAIYRPNPSGNFNVAALIFQPGVVAYKEKLEYAIASGNETDLVLFCQKHPDLPTAYPPRGH